MKLLIKGAQSILDEKLSLIERGILISIALCSDENSKIVLAKFKATCKFTSIKEELVGLHEKGYIKWSGYKLAKKSVENSELSHKVKEVIEFLNSTCNRKYGYKTKSIVTNLSNRLLEHDMDDIKLVIANRYKEWSNDPMMEKHLNPTTLFRPSKFDKYLEEAKRTRVGESFVSATNINLNDGDEITESVSKTFSDKDVYNIKIYNCDSSEELLGNGVHASRYGKDIKKTFKIQKLQPVKTHRYFYVQK